MAGSEGVLLNWPEAVACRRNIRKQTEGRQKGEKNE